MAARQEPIPPADLDDCCIMTLKSTRYLVRGQELERVKELGRVANVIVETMKHKPSDFVMAVKRILRATVNDQEQKQSLVELRASMKSGQCKYIVTCYGAMFRGRELWICMEVMDTSLDMFRKMWVDRKTTFPEPILARIAYSVIEALHYLKEELNLVHRDVKPNNILINRKGEIKLSDFGTWAYLEGSVEKTMLYRGCKPYMAPERINLNPMSTSKAAYDARSDVWSLGIIMVEVATGTHPYSKWPLKQLEQVVEEEPPKLPKATTVGQEFSEKFHDFLDKCLRKDYQSRATYTQLQKHAWYKLGKETADAIVAAFVEQIMPIVPDQFTLDVLKMLEEDEKKRS